MGTELNEQPLLFGEPTVVVDRGYPPDRLPSYVTDHRQRLRTRFMKGGAVSVADYELLELVLFRAIPRKDVKPLAYKLLETFGDFNRVITAPVALLSRVPGIGRAVICELKVVEAAAQSLARSRVIGQNVISCWDALIDYCHTILAHCATEQLHVLFLDRKNNLMSDETFAQGTVDHVPVYPREIVKRALELNASAIILVHNHPSGDPQPSEDDITMTSQIVASAETLGLTVHDHVIIGKSREVSFRSEGLI